MKSMTMPAFPYANEQQAPGMLLRDYFAAHAMAAIISNLENASLRNTPTRARVAKSAFEIADAMLGARETGA